MDFVDFDRSLYAFSLQNFTPTIRSIDPKGLLSAITVDYIDESC